MVDNQEEQDSDNQENQEQTEEAARESSPYSTKVCRPAHRFKTCQRI